MHSEKSREGVNAVVLVGVLREMESAAQGRRGHNFVPLVPDDKLHGDLEKWAGALAKRLKPLKRELGLSARDFTATVLAWLRSLAWAGCLQYTRRTKRWGFNPRTLVVPHSLSILGVEFATNASRWKDEKTSAHRSRQSRRVLVTIPPTRF